MRMMKTGKFETQEQATEDEEEQEYEVEDEEISEKRENCNRDEAATGWGGWRRERSDGMKQNE